VVDYLANPPERAQLREMIARAGLSVRDAVRSKEALYGELGLDGAVGDEALLDAMVANPILINRPVRERPTRACACAGLRSWSTRSCNQCWQAPMSMASAGPA
jgi:arsenate reductase